jgi:FixJ family two-component response regulator
MNDVASTVYLVDDEPAVLRALTRLLTSAGLKPVAFDSPRGFLESINAATAGCLVLDVSMPGLNGLDLQQALITKGCALPIIFLTGLGDIPTSVKAMKRGAQDFLTKPVDDEQLLAAIASALERGRLSLNAQQEIARIRERLRLDAA